MGDTHRCTVQLNMQYGVHKIEKRVSNSPIKRSLRSAKCTCIRLALTTTRCYHNCYTHNSYLTVIGVHEMHGRMHPNYCQITILLVVDLRSSLAYFMMTHHLPIAGKLPIKLWLLGNYQQTSMSGDLSTL